jgi:hypothetical protein
MWAISWKSVVFATLISSGLAFAMYEIDGTGTFFRRATLYHATLYAFYATLYSMIPGGFSSHFSSPTKDFGGSPIDIAYFTAVAQTSSGFGDVYPSTRAARMLVTSHIVLSFAGVANLLALTL